MTEVEEKPCKAKRTCGGCNRGAPFDGPYDSAKQCWLCWLFYNNPKYRSHWEDDGKPKNYAKCFWHGPDLRDKDGKALTRYGG